MGADTQPFDQLLRGTACSGHGNGGGELRWRYHSKIRLAPSGSPYKPAHDYPLGGEPNAEEDDDELDDSPACAAVEPSRPHYPVLKRAWAVTELAVWIGLSCERLMWFGRFVRSFPKSGFQNAADEGDNRGRVPLVRP